MALGPMILGHTPADVIAAAKSQLDRGLLYGGQSELEFEAARLICEMVPCAERVRFASSGSEAVQRAEERRVGKECVSTCRSRWSAYHYKKKNIDNRLTSNTRNTQRPSNKATYNNRQ